MDKWIQALNPQLLLDEGAGLGMLDDDSVDVGGEKFQWEDRISTGDLGLILHVDPSISLLPQLGFDARAIDKAM
ncbi:hypothetical protein DXG01_003987 [Tephrocybe rancida]|nr:hypothetical protein DXG01_003987 [Tephrocybe rancida]